MARHSRARPRSRSREKAVGFYTKRYGRRKVVHPITARKGRASRVTAVRTALVKPLDYFQERAKELERKNKAKEGLGKKAKPVAKAERKPKPSPAEAPKPEPKEKPTPQGKPAKLRVRRARGREGVLPKGMARQILLARMKRLYPDSDYETLVENMMDDYDPMVTFNENMDSLARSGRWSAFAKAFGYASDAEAGQFTAAEAGEYEREELYRQLDEMIGRIYEEHPLEFQEYLVRRGIAEAV